MKFKKGLFTSLLAVGLAAGGIGAVNAETLRFASEAPRTDTQSIAGEKFSELLKAKTNGALDIKIFADSSLGAFQAAISGVRGGTIDMAVSGSANFSGLVPLLGVFDIPFMFKDSAHAYRVLDGKIGQDMLDRLGEFGMKGLAFWEIGFRSLANSRRPVNKAEDIKGLKLRTTPNPAHIKAFQLLGAAPQPMPFSEVYSALETKAIDGHENPPSVMLSTKMHEVQKYLSLTKHAYTALVVIMNKAKFDALKPEYQQILLQEAVNTAKFQRDLNAKGEAAALAELRKNGMQIVDNPDVAGIKKIVADETRKIFIEKNGDELLKAIDALR